MRLLCWLGVHDFYQAYSYGRFAPYEPDVTVHKCHRCRKTIAKKVP